MTLKDYMMLYGVTLGKRRTKKQRYLFAKSVKEYAVQNKANFSIQDHNAKRYSIENIVVGDIESAEYIIACGYDTPIKNILKCNYYPFHPEKTINKQRNDLIVHLIISAFLFILSFATIKFLDMHFVNICLALILLFLGIFNLLSKTNEFNFNRYSASVATSMKMLEENKKLCVVFCDRTCQGYDGYRLLAKELTDSQKVILLDSIAYGEKLVIAHSDSTNINAKYLSEQLNAIDKLYDSDKISKNVFAILPKAVFITSGTISNGELIVENTGSKNDIRLDMIRLERIAEAILNYIK